jgi:hypothetical protein
MIVTPFPPHAAHRALRLRTSPDACAPHRMKGLPARATGRLRRLVFIAENGGHSNRRLPICRTHRFAFDEVAIYYHKKSLWGRM